MTDVDKNVHIKNNTKKDREEKQRKGTEIVLVWFTKKIVYAISLFEGKKTIKRLKDVGNKKSNGTVNIEIILSLPIMQEG